MKRATYENLRVKQTEREAQEVILKGIDAQCIKHSLLVSYEANIVAWIILYERDLEALPQESVTISV